jgi:hypothetical protein
MADLEGWKTNVGALLTKRLPNHDLASARALATSHLSSIGGWVPDDVGDPTGDGSPNGGPSDQAVVDAIVTDQLSRTHTVTFSIPVTLTTTVTGSFAPGTNSGDVLAALETDAENRILDALSSNSSMVSPTFGWGSAAITASRSGGSLGAAQMVAVNSAVGANQLTDPASIATAGIRSEFSLTNTWVSTEVYTRDASPSTPISVKIEQFTSTSYTTRATPGYFFVVTLEKRSCRPQTYTKVLS